MRPGQQNKRMRGRNRSKGPNPMTRVFESNGPDVKIRGTAAHIAEKYLTLARDASSSGDPVAAENYLQHAEHYSRIVAAANAQQQPQHSSGTDERGDDEEADTNDRFSPPAFLQRGPQQNQPNGPDRGRQDMNGARHGGDQSEGRPPRRERGEPRSSETDEGDTQRAAEDRAQPSAVQASVENTTTENTAPENPVAENAGAEDEAPRRPRRRGRYRRKDDAAEGTEASAENGSDTQTADSAA